MERGLAERGDRKGVKFWGFVSRLNEFYWPDLLTVRIVVGLLYLF